MAGNLVLYVAWLLGKRSLRMVAEEDDWVVFRVENFKRLLVLRDHYRKLGYK